MILPQGTILHQDYQIYGVLGAGGMSVTYCACTKLKPVVLKQFNPMRENREVLDMEEEREKFGEEARKLLQLDHPNIVHIENIIEDEEAKNVFLVMELLRGITLEEYLQEIGKIAEQEAYEMLTPIFYALETVHKEHLVYRDVKPSNIMVCDDGTMKLIDFGNARNEDNYTKTALLTEGYAPPEQYDQHGDQGPWTDVYALCATLYRMITGKKPPTSLLRYRKDRLEIPENLKRSEELKKGLALEVEDRWQTVEELQAALGISNLTENIKYAAKKSLKKAAEVAGEKIVEGFEFDRVQVDADESKSRQCDASWERETEIISYKEEENEEQETEYVPKKISDHSENMNGVNEELPDKDAISEESIDSGCEEKTKYFDVDKKSIKREKLYSEESGNELQDDPQKTTEALKKDTSWVKTTEYVAEVSENKASQREGIRKINKSWILTRKDAQYMLGKQENNNIFIIPDGVTEIAECAFSYFNTLKDINIPDSVISIGYSAFNGCEELEEVTIPDSVVQMKSSIFMCCSGLRSAHLSKNMTEIVRRMFKNCTKLQEIIIPDGVTQIGDEAFEGCKNLRKIYIPGSVRSIAVNAFNGCGSLTDIYFLHTTQTIKIARNAFQGVVATLHYRSPAKSMEWLRQGYGGAFERVCMQEQDLLMIHDEKDTCSLGKVTEAAGEKIVEDFKFNRVKADADVSESREHDASWERETEFIVDRKGWDWEQETEYIDGVSKKKTSQRKDIKEINESWIFTRENVRCMLGKQENNIFVIPDGFTEIAECAFSNFNTLKGINIPDSVTSVGYSAFSGCEGLEEVTIPDSVVQMKSSVFMCCSGLQSAHLSKNMTEIVRRMFKNCTKLQEIIIPDGVTQIGDEAFEGCKNLRKIYIPGSVRSIAVNAFNGCGSLTDIYFLHTTQTIKIARNAFQGVMATLHYRFPAKSMEWLRQGYGGTFERICMQEQDRQDLPTLQGRKDKRSIWQRIKDMLY